MSGVQNDVIGTKLARSILGKHGVDLSRADLRVSHGVCYVRGVVTPIKGSAVADIKTHMEHLVKVLRQKQEIRDVVLECTFR